MQGIVNNGRFLILPWVRVLGLASKILALSARQLPHDWQTRYGHRPLLLETLVDASRFRGTCYRAATGSMLDRPPDAVAWIGSTKPTPTPSKTSMSIRWSVMPADIYAAIPPCKQILQKSAPVRIIRFCSGRLRFRSCGSPSFVHGIFRGDVSGAGRYRSFSLNVIVRSSTLASSLL